MRILVLVVGVEDVGELGLVVTHAVGTVDTGSSVTLMAVQIFSFSPQM
jgi:hypothetical protein